MKILNLLRIVVVFLIVVCIPIKMTADNFIITDKIENTFNVEKPLNQRSKKEIAILNALEEESLIEPTIKELGINDRNNVLCLALNMYHEARGSTVEDQIATTYVVFNRYYISTYPLNNRYETKNLCDIVFDDYQFCWTNEKVLKTPKEKTVWKDIQNLALQLYTNSEHQKLAKLFALKHYVISSLLQNPKKPKWINKRKLTVEIGAHSYMAIMEKIDDNIDNQSYIMEIIKKGLSLVK